MIARLLRQWESPPTWLLLFSVIAYLQARYLPIFSSGGAGRLIGFALIGAGIALLISAALQFSRHATTILPREVPAAMISTGAYAYSRNPIYVADAIILAGLTLVWDAASLVLVPVFMAVITWRFILGEEAGMRAQFGAVFDGYAARVPRWIGPVRGKTETGV
jgi:protein-S-isoprenylcysteine O-methyltransferase Ste14